MTFQEAKEECITIGGHIVEPLNAQEGKAISELVNEYDAKYYWIGLDREENSRQALLN